jgi:hypothetical protein
LQEGTDKKNAQGMPQVKRATSFKELSVRLLDQVKWLHCHDYITPAQSSKVTSDERLEFQNASK